jgi:DNA-dependent protein kinase catalytic subunit
MQNLHTEITRPETHVNIKIFILKILINRPELFQPYAKHWLIPICEYMSDKQNGGKGFHYFVRDLCTILIIWKDFEPEDSTKVKLACTMAVDSLIRALADKTKRIFNKNVCK